MKPKRNRPSGGTGAVTKPAKVSTGQSNCPADIREQLHRARRLHLRSAPLDCGCKWACHCTFPPQTEHQIDGWRDAADYIIATSGCVPLLPLEVLRALYRRGGADRALAEKIHAANGGVAA